MEYRTAPTTLTLDAIEAEVRALAKQSPLAERECTYVGFDDNQPHCILGCAMHALGVGIYDLDQMDGEDWNDVAEGFELEHESGQSKWLFAVQSAQDRGMPWGKAVAWCDDHAEQIEAEASGTIINSGWYGELVEANGG